MVKSSTLRYYEVDTLNEYFELITDSIFNGHFGDTTMYISKLSADQKTEFIDWCKLCEFVPTSTPYVISIQSLIQIIKN